MFFFLLPKVDVVIAARVTDLYNCLLFRVLKVISEVCPLLSMGSPCLQTKTSHYAAVTLGSDKSTILESDLILLILKSELDVPILKCTYLQSHYYDSSEPIILLEKCVNNLSFRSDVRKRLYDDRTMIANQKH